MKEINFLSVGMLLIFAGVFIIFFGALLSALSNKNQTNEKSNVKFSFVGLVGPIPFGFGNDKRFFVFSLIIALVLFIITLLFFYKGK